MVSTDFETLGFSSREQRVYVALVETGKCSATSLSKRVRMPRATLYSVLDSLLEKGVISREPIRGSRLFLPNNLTSLKRIVDRETELLEAKKSAADELMRVLGPNFKNSKEVQPKLQFFEGQQNIENMLYEYLPIWRESYSRVSDYTLWGYQDHTFVESYRRWHDFMWATRQTEEKICLFSNSTDIEKELQLKIPNREVRLLPKGAHFSSSIWVYGDYIVMAVTGEKTHYAYHLKDPRFAGNLATIFSLLWNAV